MQKIADNFASNGFRWVPLVTKNDGLACALDILFLRRDMPEGLIRKGGDIDNRIKVFLDALRKPEEAQEVAGFIPTADEDPFFCLLQDDYYITELNISTDRLLKPVPNIHDVLLVVDVRVEIVDINRADYEFLR